MNRPDLWANFLTAVRILWKSLDDRWAVTPQPINNEKLNGNFKTGIQGVKYAWSWCFLLLNIKYRHYRAATSIFVKYCGLFKILESDFLQHFEVWWRAVGGGLNVIFGWWNESHQNLTPSLWCPNWKVLKMRSKSWA